MSLSMVGGIPGPGSIIGFYTASCLSRPQMGRGNGTVGHDLVVVAAWLTTWKMDFLCLTE